MKHEVLLWVDGKPTELHSFELEYGVKNWYITITSLSAFGSREGGRLFKRHNAGHWDVEGKRGQVGTVGGSYANQVPEIKHETLWDLYKAIGYDYKLKRYIK
jgi:hypothetical protein